MKITIKSASYDLALFFTIKDSEKILTGAIFFLLFLFFSDDILFNPKLTEKKKKKLVVNIYSIQMNPNDSSIDN